MRRFLTWGSTASAVLGILCVVLLVLAIQKQNASSSTTAATSAPVAAPPAPVSVAFVGDGWTSGSAVGGQGPANYTELLASRHRWTVTNVAVYGSGYVAGRTMAPQVPEVLSADPRLVVVSGGRADSDADPVAVREAASRLYRDIRSRLPRATVVVIGPIWLGDEPPQRMREVNDAVRAAAAGEKLPYVDPVADRWFVGRDLDGIGARGDLNDRGHRRMAELVEDALRRAGALTG